MNSNKKTGRIIGILLLFIFISGVIIFQFLQGPVLFSDNYLTLSSQKSSQIISSLVLGIFNGIASIIIAVLLIPIFKKFNTHLAYLYFAFSILNFISIMVDNASIVSMLELSKEFVKNGKNDSLNLLKIVFYEKHFWTHYFYLLISCFPVFVLYYTFYVYKLIPRIISGFGLIAVIIMFIEELFSIFGNSVSMNMLLPMGLIQLILPIWLISKGLSSSKLETEIKN